MEIKNQQYSDDLTHYGILGMKWGKRRARISDPDAPRRKKELKERTKRQKILSSPRLLAKNIDKFTKDEIAEAMNKMRLNRDLRQLEIGEIKKGSDYVNAYLAVGTSAAAVYGLYKSPLGQKITESFKKLK